ncbi:hypothetical protein QQS21_006653 [Conoideocrella luteorostrata]|uniref:Uncharacterized protein n=1 Tax=Conoideocrella luteorostrata TaxID=1105319 RepID=A0AAJ0CM56_9HYPO|nr:hypothetical protein QQS21_006653 [Conoideocrella luteorostrata]
MEVFVGLGFRELNPSKDDPHYQIVKQLVISVLAFGSAAISAHIWLAYITVREIWALYAQKTLPTTGNLKTGDVP